MVQPELAAVFVILVFAGIVFLMIRSSKRSQEEKRSRARKLGFEPLEAVPPGLFSRLENLHQRHEKQDLAVQNLSRQRGLERDLYLFDLVDTHDEDSVLATEMIGVISHRLALPRFTLTSLPPIDTEKILGSMMDRILDKIFDWAAKYQQLSRISFPENPAFEEKFVIYGRDPHALRKLFSGYRASYLASLELPLMMTGSGDFLTMEIGFPDQYEHQKKQDNLDRLYRESGDLIRLMEDH